jgi:RNA methyltransferase, TrmH family
MQPISTAKVKQFASLGRKKERQEAGLFLAEGEKLCHEALAAGLKPVALVATAGMWAAHPAWEAATGEAYLATEQQLERISTQAQPEGAIAVLQIPSPPTELPLQGPAILLHNVADPGNLGALLRTAAWYGFKAIYTTIASVEVTNPKVVRASMGAVFHVPVVTIADFDDFVAKYAQRISAAFLPAGRDWLLLGSESHGLPVYYRDLPGMFACTLPYGPAGLGESLNLAATGAVLADRWARPLQT